MEPKKTAQAHRHWHDQKKISLFSSWFEYSAVRPTEFLSITLKYASWLHERHIGIRQEILAPCCRIIIIFLKYGQFMLPAYGSKCSIYIRVLRVPYGNGPHPKSVTFLLFGDILICRKHFDPPRRARVARLRAPFTEKLKSLSTNHNPNWGI